MTLNRNLRKLWRAVRLPRLHDFNCRVINGLRRISGVHVPLVSNASPSAVLDSLHDQFGTRFRWLKVQKNCTALHLEPLNNFCIATAKLNEQNHLEHSMTTKTTVSLGTSCVSEVNGRGAASVITSM